MRSNWGSAPRRTLGLGIGPIPLTPRTIPLEDHLLPKYVESILLANRYLRFPDYAFGILNRLTLQADHVVVGTCYSIVPGHFRYRIHLLNKPDFIELLECLVDGPQRNHRKTFLHLLINDFGTRMLFGKIQGLVDGQPLISHLEAVIPQGRNEIFVVFPLHDLFPPFVGAGLGAATENL